RVHRADEHGEGGRPGYGAALTWPVKTPASIAPCFLARLLPAVAAGFLGAALLAVACISRPSAAAGAERNGEVLHNGIRLPVGWPPRPDRLTREPMPVPYLQSPPAVIPIDVGRQLFVDDFLIERTTLRRTF